MLCQKIPNLHVNSTYKICQSLDFDGKTFRHMLLDIFRLALEILIIMLVLIIKSRHEFELF